MWFIRTFPVYNLLGKIFNRNKAKKQRREKEKCVAFERKRRKLLCKCQQKEKLEINKLLSQFFQVRALLKHNWVLVSTFFSFPVFFTLGLTLAVRITLAYSYPTPPEGDSVDKWEFFFLKKKRKKQLKI